MLASLENLKENRCVFCGFTVASVTSKTCGNPLCTKGWWDHKLYERNKTASCEFAFVRGDRVFCKKGNFKGKMGEQGYVYEWILQKPPSICKNCNDWQDLGGGIDG